MGTTPKIKHLLAIQKSIDAYSLTEQESLDGKGRKVIYRKKGAGGKQISKDSYKATRKRCTSWIWGNWKQCWNACQFICSLRKFSEADDNNTKVIRAKIGESMIQQLLTRQLRIWGILDQVYCILILTYIPKLTRQVSHAGCTWPSIITYPIASQNQKVVTWT